jgi:hypothetical protein
MPRSAQVLQDEAGPARELWKMAHLGTPMAIRVAATLRIADRCVPDGATAAEITAAAGTDPDATKRLMRFLAARGLFECDTAGRFTLTPLGEPLLTGHPAGLREGLDIEGVGRPELAFVQLLHSVRAGEAAFPAQFGCSFWDDLAANAQRAAAFNDFMGADIADRSPAVLAAYDWAAQRHVVDVGGGDGSLMVTLLTAFPSLRGTVVELPANAGSVRAALLAADVAGRGRVVEGSFFDPLPAGADAYLLSWILHDWADRPATAILRRCAEAAGPGGRVLVVEKTGADGRRPHTGLDLRMLAYFGGKERDIEELAQLGAAAGLAVAAVHPASALSVVELIPSQELK